MMNFSWIVLGTVVALSGVAAWIDVKYERRQIERYLRIGGARILRFQWVPFKGWMGADSKSKHYDVTFEDHHGRVIRALFTYTAGIGVMKTSGRVLRGPARESRPQDGS